MSIKDYRKKNVLITGASSGIGRELCYAFAKKGFNVYLVARTVEQLNIIKDDLEKIFNVDAYVLVKDLTREESIYEIANQLKNVDIDILINDAGIGNYGEFCETTLEKVLKTIDLNIKSLVMLTHIFANMMKKRKNGTIINIASIGAFYPGPLMANYYATKAYVLSFSESLNREMKGTGVRVVAFCPGYTQTNFLTSSNIKVTKTAHLLQAKTKNVANSICNFALSSRNRTKVYGFLNNAYIFLIRFLPRNWVTNISYRMQKTRR